MSEENEDPVVRKKRKQHEAWKRWYASDKGKAYRQKVKERKAIAPEAK